VIKLEIVPVAGIVATGAVIAQIAFVNVVFTVAGLAGAGCVAMLFCRRMAAIAGCLNMLAEQFEVSERMIERCFIQSRNIHITAFVIGVAGRTPLRADVCRLAMKSKCPSDVACNVLMTVQAQGILLGATESLVARRTFRLQLCMSLNHRTWHDQ